MKKIAILGSTGSIGTQTLEIVREHKDIQVTALAAGSNVILLEQQIREFRPLLAVLWEEQAAKDLQVRVRDLDVKILFGITHWYGRSSCDCGNARGGNTGHSHRGDAWYSSHHCRYRSWKNHCSRQQRDVGHGWTYYYAAGKGKQCANSSSGQ